MSSSIKFKGGNRDPALPRDSNFVRRRYEDLHPKDQQVKQSKKLCIESNWGCEIQDCLPVNIRPRCEVKKGSKARVGDADIAEEVWWNWSVELLKSIEELSNVTVGNLQYAQTLFSIEVNRRQSNPKSTQRKILELLLGDAQRVVDEERKKVMNEGEPDGVAGEYEGEYEAGVYEADYEADAMQHQTELYHGIGANTYNNNMPVNDDYDYGDVPKHLIHYNGGGTVARTEAEQFVPVTVGTSRDVVAGHLKTTELKARAAHLRAEANRFEAEACQLEAEAQEARKQLQSME